MVKLPLVLDLKFVKLNTFFFYFQDFKWSKKIQDVLKNKFRLDKFRQKQLACINAILSNQDVILLMPTGGGKSLCYQLPALVTSGKSQICFFRLI